MRVRMCPEDREKYGGPEWIDFNLDLLGEKPSSFVEQVEDTLGWTVHEFGQQLQRASTRATRAAFWCGLKLAGHDVDWATFDPHVYKADQDETADTDPLAGQPTRPSRSRARASKR